MVFGNIGDMMKMAREMQGKLKDIKAQLAKEIYEGKSKSVTAKVSGEMELKEIKIDPAVVDPNNVGKLEKEVGEAVGKAFKTAKDEAAHKMKGLTGGLGLPGMF
jgi:DNA-binding YbaB/EbfC family protein